MIRYNDEIYEQAITALNHRFEWIKTFGYTIYIIDFLKFCDSDIHRLFYTFSLGTYEIGEDSYQADYKISLDSNGNYVVEIL